VIVYALERSDCCWHVDKIFKSKESAESALAYEVNKIKAESRISSIVMAIYIEDLRIKEYLVEGP
jgi:uncharacterized protein YfcZ (UPF0381/DUF406 family)